MPKLVYNVAMSCEGCTGAVTRVLKKLPEVSDIQIDMEAQTVTVETTLDKDAILAQINKTGKACSFAQEE